MINPTQVRSGFDAELLVSSVFFERIFQLAIDTGELELIHTIPTPLGPIVITLFPPPATEFPRLYEVNSLANPLPFPMAPPPPNDPGSFRIVGMRSAGLAWDDESDRLSADINVNIQIQPPPGVPFLPCGGVNPPNMNNTTVLCTLEMEMRYSSRGMQLDVNGIPQIFPETQVVNGAYLTAQFSNIQGAVINYLNCIGISNGDILQQLNAGMPGRFPFLPAGTDSRLNKLRMRVFPADTEHPLPTVGFYINLLLRREAPSGTISPNLLYLPDRGSIRRAENFLGSGCHLAFASRWAHHTADPPSFANHIRVLLRERIDRARARASNQEVGNDWLSQLKKIGKLSLLQSFRVETVTVGQSGDGVRISIRSSLEIPGRNPRATIRIFLRPVFGIFGLDWDISADHTYTGLGRLAERLLRHVIQEVINILVKNRWRDWQGENANLLDLLALRITIFRKYWDPVYTTLHQLIPVTGTVNVSNEGAFLEVNDLNLFRSNRFPGEVRLRDKVRGNDGQISHLLFRISEDGANSPDLQRQFPATVRGNFGPIIPGLNPDHRLVNLSIQEVFERIQVSGEHIRELPAGVPYRVEKVHLNVERHPDHIRRNVGLMLCMSDHEHQAIIEALDDMEEYQDRRTEFEEIILSLPQSLSNREALIARLRILAREMTNQYYSLVNRRGRLLLRPSEYGLLQSWGLLEIQGYELRQTRDGELFYRDDPGFLGFDFLEPEISGQTHIDNLRNVRPLFTVTASSESPYAFSLLDLPRFLAENGAFHLRDNLGNLIPETVTSFEGLDHEETEEYPLPGSVEVTGEEFVQVCVSWPNEDEICTPHDPRRPALFLVENEI